jgi:rhomboid family GlyGly-CTERM serine protease
MIMATIERVTLFQQAPVTIICTILLMLMNMEHLMGLAGLPWPAISGLLEFDRQLIAEGELWRLLTCHLVHWSSAHFLLDTIVFLALGITFEPNIGRRYFLVLLCAGLCISLALLLFQPDMIRYRGISGLINTQLLLGCGLALLDEKTGKTAALLYSGIFCLHTLKLLFEQLTNGSIFHTGALGQMGEFTPLAHLVGALIGISVLAVVLYRPDPVQVSVDSR